VTVHSYLLVVAALILSFTALSGDCAFPAEGKDNPLATLRPGHPRLIALDADIARVRGLVASDPVARKWHEDLRARASQVLTQPPVEYHLIGPRLLQVSREALRRIVTLGLLYRLDGDRAYADRAISELMTICAFKDWHPPHFLDTAEMTHAAAIGYDWLYDLLTPAQRAIVKQAIIEKGIEPALELYKGNKGWVGGVYNWTQVCNGGITIGALAIADEEPALANLVLSYARRSIAKTFDEFEPDGAWLEGCGYWNYGTRYAVYFLAALQTALGTDFGFTDHPGFALAGDFRVYLAGPTYRVFNFADGGEGIGRAGQMFWFADRYHKPLYAWFEASVPASPDPWALLWYVPGGTRPADLPLDKQFRRADVAVFRSAWGDPNAVFVGFKGGRNPAPHGHLDLGTFVLDALGQRWACDLGADDYNLPGYFGKQRWTYYRLSTAGHNTLTVNDQNQALDCQAPITAFSSSPDRAFAVADLSAAYPMMRKVQRGVALLARKHVLIQDEIEAEKPVDVVWAMHTRAELSLDGATATLAQGGKSLTARILSPQGAQFATESADPGPPQARNEGVTKLMVRMTGVTGEARLAILLTPDRDMRSLSLTPLTAWVAAAGPH
jgi:hypothetical protein